MIENKNKISVIILVEKENGNLERCIESILKQSYKNFEIILVYDTKVNIKDIIDKYNNKIKYICCDKNNLLEAKVKGIELSTGDYISFLNSDEYVSVDFYRPLIQKAMEKNADIAVGNMILECKDGTKRIYNLFDSVMDEELQDKECIKKLLEQEGLCYFWYLFSNKIYSKKICDKTVEYINKIENKDAISEILMSIILYYYSDKLIRLNNDAVFYHEKEYIFKDNSLENYMNRVDNTFENVSTFLKQENTLQFEENVKRWKSLVCYNALENIKNEEERLFITEKIQDEQLVNISKRDYFYSISTLWDNTLENVKATIIDENIKYVSFDIYDTLIVRPFIEPNDLFKLLDNYFRKITGIKIGIEFSKIRILAEQKAREIKYKENNTELDITLDEIYKIMSQKYELDDEILDKMKSKECEYEIRFTSRRNTAYDLYTLALSLGKKVICVSDMYLPKETIKAILDKNGYCDIEKLYVSSETKYMKSSGKLYQIVLDEIKVEPQNMVHIGDNYKSDVENAKKNGIVAIYFPKGTNLYWKHEMTNNLSKIFYESLPGYIDNSNAINFIGIRCMIALMINKYFDNPYRYFNSESDFNADPILIGYHVLGMHLFAVSKWLIEDTIEKGYENIVFMARDGYCPMRAFEILKSVYKEAPTVKYLPVSRKSLFQISLNNKMDFYKLSEVINVNEHTPRKVLRYIYDILDTEKIESICKEHGINLDKQFLDISEFNDFIKLVIDNFYNKQKHNKKLQLIKEYFCNIYSGKSCTFDIGYSARPELYISNLCDKKIDTYFENIGSDIAYQHAQIGGFKLNTFYDYKPSVTGTLRESIISELGPSCIGYDCSENKVKPIYENYSISYQEKYILSKLQKYSLQFVKDMIDTFGNEIKNLYYQKAYAVLPLEVYIQSANEIDVAVLDCMIFEDSVRDGNSINIINVLNKERKDHNQQNIQKLFYINDYEKSISSNETNTLEEKKVERNIVDKIKNVFKIK